MPTPRKQRWRYCRGILFPPVMLLSMTDAHTIIYMLQQRFRICPASVQIETRACPDT
ncbi:MAG: hypothetical protein ACOY15_06825 [Pseudomonadota bacterium]